MSLNAAVSFVWRQFQDIRKPTWRWASSNYSSLCALHCESKKRHTTNVDNFAKNWSIFKILSLVDSEQNFLQNKYLQPTIPYRCCCITLWNCNVSKIV